MVVLGVCFPNVYFLFTCGPYLLWLKVLPCRNSSNIQHTAEKVAMWGEGQAQFNGEESIFTILKLK